MKVAGMKTVLTGFGVIVAGGGPGTAAILFLLLHHTVADADALISKVDDLNVVS